MRTLPHPTDDAGRPLDPFTAWTDADFDAFAATLDAETRARYLERVESTSQTDDGRSGQTFPEWE